MVDGMTQELRRERTSRRPVPTPQRRRPARHRALPPGGRSALHPVRQLVAVAAVCILAGTAGATATFVATRLDDPSALRLPQLTAAAGDDGTDATRRTVDGEVLDLLLAHYYRPLDPEALRGTRLDRLPAVLGDRYTHYLKPDAVSAVALSDSGHFSGIGVVLAAGTAATAPEVTDVVHGSPADHAGIRPGDHVLSVEGAPVTGTPLADVLAVLRGRPGTAVSVTYDRDGQQRAVRLTRALLSDTVVSSRLLAFPAGAGRAPRQVGYLRISEFDEHTGAQVRAAVTALTRSGATAFVVDLRHNPGGLVDEAVTSVSAFVPRGTVVYRQTGQHVPATPVSTDARPVAPSQPMLVLVDAQTASSGEIVAAALHDTRGAVLAGRRTFGKGVIQRTWPIRDGALKITVAEYLTPDGHHVDRGGLVPDRELADPAAAPERLGPLVLSALP